jgi:hypothetical protein
MKVVELKDLHRRNTAVDYIKELTAVAVMEWKGHRDEADVTITLEHKPIGPPEVRVKLLDSVDWPLMPVLKAIREEIAQLESQGKLP